MSGPKGRLQTSCFGDQFAQSARKLAPFLFTEREGISHVAFGTWRGLAGGLAGESSLRHNVAGADA